MYCYVFQPWKVCQTFFLLFCFSSLFPDVLMNVLNQPWHRKFIAASQQEPGDNSLLEGREGLRTPSAQEHKQTESRFSWPGSEAGGPSLRSHDGRGVCPWGSVAFPLATASFLPLWTCPGVPVGEAALAVRGPT